MSDAFSGQSAIDAPANDAATITKSDSVNFTKTCRGIYCGVGGDIAVVTLDGSVVTFVGVLGGTILPIRATRVNSTNTTASSMVALW